MWGASGCEIMPRQVQSEGNSLSGRFNGTYADLLALSAEDLRESFGAVAGIEDAQAVLDGVAARAVARFKSPLDLFSAYPETLTYDFGTLSFGHGDKVGDALRALAVSMIREEMIYEMNDALFDSFEGGAYSAVLDCLDGAGLLANSNVGVSEWDRKTAAARRSALAEEGRLEQATWSILRGAHNGAAELLSGRMGVDGVLLIAEMGGVEVLQRLKSECGKLAYLLSEDREKFGENMAEAWKEANDASSAPAA